MFRHQRGVDSRLRWYRPTGTGEDSPFLTRTSWLSSVIPQLPASSNLDSSSSSSSNRTRLGGEALGMERQAACRGVGPGPRIPVPVTWRQIHRQCQLCNLPRETRLLTIGRSSSSRLHQGQWFCMEAEAVGKWGDRHKGRLLERWFCTVEAVAEVAGKEAVQVAIRAAKPPPVSIRYVRLTLQYERVRGLAARQD